MKEARLQFALRYQYWTLEDWKNVIWSDETSVLLGHRRGSYKVWRRPWEITVRSCIRERWKGFSEFMFWGCFTYDYKGPCHIWKRETADEKRKSTAILNDWNRSIEEAACTQWEANEAIRRAGLKRQGKRRQWKFNASTGAFVRDSKGGVDWWRYLNEILIPKLLPFAQSCKCQRLGTIVQEDKAPSHTSSHHKIYFDVLDIQRFLWPGNSPDLNMIEPCWPWIKRRTTRKGPLVSRIAAEKAWLQAWEELEQWRIQAWIERIPRHIKEVIRLEGGNDYREGAEDKPRSWKRLERAAKEKGHQMKEAHRKAILDIERRCNLPVFFRDPFLLREPIEVEWLDDNEWNQSKEETLRNPRRPTRRRRDIQIDILKPTPTIDRVQKSLQKSPQKSRKPRKPMEFKLRLVEGKQLTVDSTYKASTTSGFEVKWAKINQRSKTSLKLA
jgi:hypothetical protein